MTKLPKPPPHLSADSQRLWTAILKAWPIDDPAHQAVLRAGLEARDRAERCRVLIDLENECVLDRFQQRKPHPLLAAERDSRSAFITAIKALGLDPSSME